MKTSLAPGSKVVTEYLKKAGLTPYLDQLGFNLVGYGCTTCIGNSGPLPDDVSAEIESAQLVVGSVLSGNRNFEGRIQQQVRANYLASPPLVVAYALAGTHDDRPDDRAARAPAQDGTPVYLRDIWPTEREIQETMLRRCHAEMFREQYADVFSGDERWQALPVPTGDRFAWEADSTYIRNPPFFEGLTLQPAPLDGHHGRARAGAARRQHHDRSHLAGRLDQEGQPGRQVPDRARRRSRRDFNSYGARRGNHEVMMRGTFANIRLRNQLAPGHRGRLDDVPARRRGDDDLRRGDEVPGRPACRWSSSPARSTDRDRRATGRPRARCCSA